MNSFTLLEYLHVLGAAVIIGTGLAGTLFLFMANRNGDVAFVAGAMRIVLVADIALVGVALALQPVTGFAMMGIAHFHIWETWIALSLCFYAAVALLWLLTIWLHNAMTEMALEAQASGAPLPARYGRFLRLSSWSAGLALLGLLTILHFMIAKPEWE